MDMVVGLSQPEESSSSWRKGEEEEDDHHYLLGMTNVPFPHHIILIAGLLKKLREQRYRWIKSSNWMG